MYAISRVPGEMVHFGEGNSAMDCDRLTMMMMVTRWYAL